jgi:SNF2 family DNA or RNA helicase
VQNDLQAMARCHRIGQENAVTVYRLVSRDTYEQQLFQCASRKYGLDEAILGFNASGELQCLGWVDRLLHKCWKGDC